MTQRGETQHQGRNGYLADAEAQSRFHQVFGPSFPNQGTENPSVLDIGGVALCRGNGIVPFQADGVTLDGVGQGTGRESPDD